MLAKTQRSFVLKDRKIEINNATRFKHQRHPNYLTYCPSMYAKDNIPTYNSWDAIQFDKSNDI